MELLFYREYKATVNTVCLDERLYWAVTHSLGASKLEIIKVYNSVCVATRENACRLCT